MTFNIRPIEEKDYPKVYKFQNTFLDEEDFEDFLKRIKANPDLYLVAIEDHKLVGVIYGHPSKRHPSIINLQGVAVDLNNNFARKGIGSKLVDKFGEAVKKRGLNKLSVGSADDPKVEKFYLKNDFYPVGMAAKDKDENELEMIEVHDYKGGLARKKKLRKKYNPHEIIFFFDKDLR